MLAQRHNARRGHGWPAAIEAVPIMTAANATAETPWQRLGNRFTLGLRARERHLQREKKNRGEYVEIESTRRTMSFELDGYIK